ncbi:MAG TPA: DUF4412 domain-containing protein [Syntrophomonadaceae bacterium]|nr:DUF4412 domain-containing protein [Syntrophomonadaceae bacterium]
MKKSWILLLAGLLLIAWTSVAGCSKKETTSAPAGNDSKPVVTEKQSSNEGKLAQIMTNVKAMKGVSYEMKSTITSTQGTMTTTTKAWASGTKARMEMEAMGTKMTTIITGAGDIYMYNAANNTAMKMPASKEQIASAWAQKDASKYKILGEEKISGQNCLVITSTDISGDNKTWISEDIGMPLKSEMKTTEGNVVSEFSNIKLGPQSDDLFTLPAGAQVVDMPKVPGQ